MIVGLSIDRKCSTCGSLRSKRFRAESWSKERGTRVKDSAKNGASKRALVSILAQPNLKTRSSVFLCSETNQKRLLRRLQLWKHRFFLKSKILIKWFKFFIWSWIFILTKKVLPLLYLHVSLPDACAKSSLIGYQLPPPPSQPRPPLRSLHNVLKKSFLSLIKRFEFFIWLWILVKKLLSLMYLLVSLPVACSNSSVINSSPPPPLHSDTIRRHHIYDFGYPYKQFLFCFLCCL